MEEETVKAIPPAVNLIITLVSSLTFLLIGFFLNSWNSARIEKRHEKNDNLKTHFHDLKDSTIFPIRNFASNMYHFEGQCYYKGSIDFPDFNLEKFDCFRAHYPAFSEQWRALVGNLAEKNEDIGGKWKNQHRKAETFKQEVARYTQDKLGLYRVALPVRSKLAAGEEGINEITMTQLYSNFFEQAAGDELSRDFNMLEIGEDSSKNLNLKMKRTIYASAKDRNTLEQLKTILVSVQDSPELKKRTSYLIESCQDIKAEFVKLEFSLGNIESRGLISKDTRYRFKYLKECPICTELFFTK